MKPPGTIWERLKAFLWYDVISFVYVLILCMKYELFKNQPVLQVDKLGKGTGQVAVITGGPRGLALGMVKRLLQMDYTVVMGVRNIDDSKNRLQNFSKVHPELPFAENVKFYQMDLYSLTSVKKFAQEVLENFNRIDLLLCNAGIMNVPYSLTEDGYESHFQVNYLSHFLLVQQLQERLKETSKSKGSPSRIIFTSTPVYAHAKLDFNDLATPLVYTAAKSYYGSKCCQVAFMIWLQQQMDKSTSSVHSYCVHPGVIYTDMVYSAFGKFGGSLAKLFRNYLNSIENGADTILWPAFNPKYDQIGGIYMVNGGSAQIKGEACDRGKQQELFELSLKLIKK